MSKSTKLQDGPDGALVAMTEAGGEEGHPIAPISSATDFGYQQAMPRTKTLLNTMAMMIVLSSVPFGIGTTFIFSLSQGGTMNAFWGWIIMSCITVCIAVSLAEIASRFPVAGGAYYWSYILTPAKWAPVSSWVVGWLSVVGHVIVTLTANFGTAQILLSSVNIFNPDFVPTQWATVLCAWALIISMAVIAIFGQRYIPWVDNITIVWILAGIVATVITLPITAASGRRSAYETLIEWQDAGSGWPTGWSFVLGLTQGAYCLSPTGMLASMAEEAIKPELTIPRAMVGGIAFNGVLGLVYLLPIIFTVGDVSSAIDTVTGQPLPEMFLQATGNRGAAFVLFFVVLANGMACGLACSQAASRCIWAFARDGGLPFAKTFGSVSSRHQLPVNAFLLNIAVQMILTCIYFGSSAAFNAFVGVAVICLGTSYVVPVIISFARGRELVKQGKFYKGRVGYMCNIVTIAWYIFAIPLLSFPATNPTTLAGMNYASVVFVGFASISLAWYVTGGRKHFKGPPTIPILA